MDMLGYQIFLVLQPFLLPRPTPLASVAALSQLLAFVLFLLVWDSSGPPLAPDRAVGGRRFPGSSQAQP